MLSAAADRAAAMSVYDPLRERTPRELAMVAPAVSRPLPEELRRAGQDGGDAPDDGGITPMSLPLPSSREREDALDGRGGRAGALAGAPACADSGRRGRPWSSGARRRKEPTRG
jgi:hypothetical protein